MREQARALVDGRPYADHDAPLRKVGALLAARGVHPGRTVRQWRHDEHVPVADPRLPGRAAVRRPERRRLGGTRRGTLGVTIYNPSIDEADMGINTGYAWNLGCQELAASYDLQTVLLHENGHVVGLDHSNDTGAVMYPSYQQAECTLGQDDINGIRAIYP